MAVVSSPHFIGRRGELELLERLIAQSGAGEGRVVLVSGEAGVGKSRLVTEAARYAQSSNHRVLAGGCVSMREDAAPLAPLAEALRGLAHDTPRGELERLLGPARALIAGLVPAFAETSGREPGTGLMHISTQRRLHSQLVEVMSRLARDRPLMLIVEDIHWADRATLDLLSLLARNLRAAPCTLITTYRDDEPDADPRHGLTSFLAEIERLQNVQHIALARFTRSEVHEQVSDIRHGGRLSAVVDDVFARSSGNPFFVEELLAAGPETDELPFTLNAVLDARLAALSDDARLIVSATAVRSTESSEAELAGVTKLDDASLARALHELLDRKILVRRRIRGMEVLDFRHVLFRTAAYAAQLPSERRRLHLAFAEQLEADVTTPRDPFRLAELARHWEAANDLRRAFTAAITAASAAEAAYQPGLAHEQYERALRLLDVVADDDLGSDVDHAELFELAARSASATGSARSIEHIERAIELVDPAIDPVRAGLLYERLGRYRWYGVNSLGAMEAYSAAVRLVPSEPLSTARARVTAGIAQALMIYARFAESMPYCQEALANARAVSDRAIESHATDTLGVNTAYLGHVDEGLQLLWTANEMARQAGDVEEVGRTYSNLVDVLWTAGRYEASAELARESFPYLRDHGLAASYGAGILGYGAWSLHLLARWAEARAMLDQASDGQMDSNSEVMNLAVSAMVEACRGQLDLARSHLEMARPLVADAIDTQLLLPFAEAETELELWAHRPAAALDSALRGIERSEPPVGGNIKRYGPVYALALRAAADLIGQPNLAEAERQSARERASRVFSAMLDAHREIESSHSAHLRLAGPYLALCMAEQTRVDQQAAPEAWAFAAEQLATLGSRYLVAYSRWRQAEAELTAGGRSGAAEPLLEAHRMAEDIGAEPLREVVAQLARRAHISLPGAERRNSHAPAAGFGLTAREIEVLRLVAAGKTNRQIGEDLFISHKTAGIHVSNVLAKLGTPRRSEAAALATRLGLI